MLGKLSQPERALVSDNLHVIADCRIDERPFTLSNPRRLEILEEEARRLSVDVMIVDTLTAAFEIENENDNAQGARVMKKLTGLAQRLDCVIVFLYHVGKARQEEGQTMHAVHRARGGCYYINRKGNKTYVDRSMCGDSITYSRSPTSTSRGYITGPRSGCYYINGNGNKAYVNQGLCR